MAHEVKHPKTLLYFWLQVPYLLKHAEVLQSLFALRVVEIVAPIGLSKLGLELLLHNLEVSPSHGWSIPFLHGQLSEDLCLDACSFDQVVSLSGYLLSVLLDINGHWSPIEVQVLLNCDSEIPDQSFGVGLWVELGSTGSVGVLKRGMFLQVGISEDIVRQLGISEHGLKHLVQKFVELNEVVGVIEVENLVSIVLRQQLLDPQVQVS